ncbi:MAG TPA: HAD-IB family hydrolase [Gallionellaceae bacterium]|nr:HAD-IB family hydrolase [Gallionellaceae bacterium]
MAAFDFDGTISRKDTFFPFLLYAFGRPAAYRALALGLLELLRRNAHLSVRDRLKAALVRRLFTSVPREELEAVAAAYAREILESQLRPKALERIRWHREQGHRCIMVSASIDLYLKHIARELGFSDLLCTRLAASGDVFTGELIGSNCRRAEKVRRLTVLLGNVAQYRIYAYGDSAGDKEMLAIAAEKFYKPFM